MQQQTATVMEGVRTTPILDAADVVVAGGGIAGCAAALAAARNGASVLLIEKQTMLGGLATAGLITYYLPLCDGEGTQMSYGIAEEFLHLSVRHHPEKGIPECWQAGCPADLRAERTKFRYETRFSPGYMALLLEETLRAAGVRLLYDTRICGVHMEEKRISHLLIENESGRSAIAAKTVVDATGSAAVLQQAGAPVRDHGQGNILASWYYYLKDGKQILREMGAAPSIMPDFDAFDGQDEAAYEALMNGRGAGQRLRWYAGTDGESVSDFIAATHEKILADLRAGDREVTILPTMPQLRMTRCLIGDYELKETENDVHFEDAIGMCGDWRKRGMRYEIPYRCLTTGAISNAWAAGRCISADDGMWDISRVIPPCAVTGEAAGTAAALMAGSDSMAGKVSPYETLAAALRAQGQRLTFGETGW